MYPVHFGNVYRAITGEKKNLFNEKRIFSNMDDDKNGSIDCGEFMRGIRRLAVSSGKEVVYAQGIKSLCDSSFVSL